MVSRGMFIFQESQGASLLLPPPPVLRYFQRPESNLTFCTRFTCPFLRFLRVPFYAFYVNTSYTHTLHKLPVPSYAYMSLLTPVPSYACPFLRLSLLTYCRSTRSDSWQRFTGGAPHKRRAGARLGLLQQGACQPVASEEYP
jgi:hypothetical protein